MPIRFATHRGRPRTSFESEKPDSDQGTQELILKRALSVTKEPIDLLLEYQFISESEHRAALHFRWLYSLRYGIQRITSSTFDDQPNTPRLEAEDSDWRNDREAEFALAATRLKRAKRYDLLCDVLVHNHWPLALRKEHLRRHCDAPQRSRCDPTISHIKEAIGLIREKP